MGMFDSFHDENGECPKCRTKVTGWQTKDLDSLGEYWKIGDFVQYRKLKRIPEKERKREYGDSPFPLFQTSKEDLSDAPLLFNGKVPVYTSCEKCNARLQGYAKILDGGFTALVEIEADVMPKQRVLIKRKTTAQTLRADYEERLSRLQESCSHKKIKWIELVWPPTLNYGRALVCLRCEKRLKVKQGLESARALTPSEATELRSNIQRIRTRRKRLDRTTSTSSSANPKLRKLLRTSIRLRYRIRLLAALATMFLVQL
jgi:hypothetical protein